MIFNAVFNGISVISQRPVHLSMLSWSSFNQYSAPYFFPSHWLLSHIFIAETTDSAERGMNPVVMTIINPRNEYWPNRGSNQRSSVLKSATLPTELWGSAAEIMIYVFDSVENIVGKRRKCWLPAFSPFSRNVFKRLLSKSC